MFIWNKWIIPGIVVIAVLTFGTAVFLIDPIEKDLSEKATDGISKEHPWAEISIDGRDMVLRGTAPLSSDAEEAVNIIKNTIGVRQVKNEADLLPAVSPYPFSAELADGTLTLSGNAPNIQSRDALLNSASKAFPQASVVNRLELAAGAPDSFDKLTGHIFQLLGSLSQGTVSLSDKQFLVEGIAASSNSYKALGGLLAEGLSGAEIDASGIIPPPASPYEFKAELGEGGISLTGHAPSPNELNSIEKMIKKSFPDKEINNNLEIASGAPEGIKQAYAYVLGILSGLEQGRVGFSDKEISLSGVAKSFAGFGSITDQLDNPPAGFGISDNAVQPVGVTPYTWSLEKEAERLVLSGHAPSSEIRSQITELIRSTFSDHILEGGMNVAGGAGEGFEDAVNFAVRMLSHTKNGSANLTDGSLQVDGSAKSADDYEKLRALAAQLPGGIAGSLEMKPPFTSPFRWSVSKNANGIRVDGHVASEESRTEILKSIATIVGANSVDDRQILASGEPENAKGTRKILLGFLGKLDAGQVSMIDSVASVTGRVGDPEVAAAIQNLFAGSLPNGISGTTNLFVPTPEPEPEPEPEVQPEPVDAAETESETDAVVEDEAEIAVEVQNQQAPESVVTELPVADPYRWSLSKTPSGVTVLGNVESEEGAVSVVEMIRSVLEVTEVSDRQIPASGAPEDFATVREIVTRQVKLLEAGQGNIIGNHVSVTGRVSDESIHDEIEETMRNSLPSGFDGSTNIVFPVVVREPEPEIVLPPIVSPYKWMIEKSAEGFAVSGHVGSDEISADLVELVKSILSVSDVAVTHEVVRGKPAGFDAARALAIRLIKFLETGKAEVIDQEVVISGKAKNQNLRNLIDRELQRKLPQGYAGQIEIDVPASKAIKAKPVEFVVKVARQCQAQIIQAIDGRQIQFETNRAVIKPESDELLKDVTKVALDCPEVRIEIAGHTDSRGRENFNLDLSEARAKAVAHRLEQSGVDADRLTIRAYGESVPIADNETVEGRGQNRRIEFNVIQ